MEITADGYLLRPHNPDDLLTYVLPFDFNPDATAPIWANHLERVLPDDSAQFLLSEHFGYAFIPTSILKLEKVLVLYGPGANGKSVIFDVINKLFGENNISEYSLESLCDKTGYYRSMIEDKLLNYCSELSAQMNTEIFKKLASGEPLDVRIIYAMPRIIRDYAKLIFNCNALPYSVEHNRAYFRRLNILGFDIIIPDAEQDKELANKIIANELTGVFNWILKGLTRVMTQRNFTNCESVNEQIEQYKRESDSVQQFIEEGGYSKDNDEKMRTGDLYSRYNNYCRDNGYKPCSNGQFSKRLKMLGFVVERDNRGSTVYIKQDIVSALGMQLP